MARKGAALMDSRLQQRVAEGRDVLRRTVPDRTRPYDAELDGLRRALDNLATAVETSPVVGGLRVGDVLEWVAAAAAALGAYFATGLAWPPLIIVAVFLAYQAQCYSSRAIPRRRSGTMGE